MEVKQVPFEDFVQELEFELNYHQLSGGTFYRQQTAELSLMVAKKVGDVSPFLKRNNTEEIVQKLLPLESEERQKDVSEMLFHVAFDLNRKINRSEKLNQYIRLKRKTMLPLSFAKKQ